MLRHIEIQGFTSIEKCSLHLQNLTVLIGANGAGKSNFIAIFRLLHHLIRGELQNFVAKAGGANALLFLGRRQTESISIKLDFPTASYHVVLAANNDDTLFFADEMLQVTSTSAATSAATSLGQGHLESQLLKLHSEHASYIKESLSALQVYHFHDTSENASMKQTGALADNYFLRADAANLAAFLYFLKHRHSADYQQIIETIQLIAPFFADFVLEPSPLNPDKIRLQWRQKGSDEYFGASQLSDGTLRMICLATLLLQPNPPLTLLIDEPELGLHPYAIEVLSALLKLTAQRRQVIVSTQSVSLVDTFEPEDIIVVDHVASASTFARLSLGNLQGWLEHYSLGDLWNKNLLGARPA